MVSGHYATALLAKQRAPAGHIVFYLFASQVLDLLWLVFHYMGLEHTEPENFTEATLDTLQVDMTYSHDLLPLPVWCLLIAVAGRALFGSWKPGWIGALLVFVHAVTDYVGGYEHFVFGPESQVVSTGLYYTAPYLAVGFEVLFIAITLAWVVHSDSKAGIRRSRATWFSWAAVFGGGSVFMLVAAKTPIANLLGTEPSPMMEGTTIPVLALIYITMIWALAWAEKQPTLPVGSSEDEK